jgi:hypothetical protein
VFFFAGNPRTGDFQCLWKSLLAVGTTVLFGGSEVEVFVFLTIIGSLSFAVYRLKQELDVKQQAAAEAAEKAARAAAEAANVMAAAKAGALRTFVMGPAPAAAAPPPAPPMPTGVDLEIPACGVDVFSGVLQAGAVYRLRFSGAYRYNGSYTADALYYKHFHSSYGGLTIDGKGLREQDSCQEDRKNSNYTCLVEASGKRLRFNLNPAGGYETDGSLMVNIEQLPAGTKTAQMLEQEEFKKSAESSRSREKQRHAEACHLKAQELKRFVHCHENFLDAKFRTEYLRNHEQEILTVLRQQWTQDYEAVFADPTLVAALRADAPEVLRWHEERIRLIQAAERAQEMATMDEEPASFAVDREVTASTAPYVSQAITELFQFTELADRERRILAEDRQDRVHRPVIERYQRAIAFYYQDLARFGIRAKTPEEAEMQYFQMCPPPAPTYYEELIIRIKAGEKISADPIRARVEDLFREELKMGGQRTRAVERKNGTERNAIDERLTQVRRERADLTEFLESIGYVVEFKDYRDQQPSLVDEFMKLHEERKQIKQILEAEGDQHSAEVVDNLYAQEQAKLFEGDSSSYT